MARNPGCAVYIGNLDEKVSERVLYEILIQVGRVVDLHIPRDKETSRPKGFAFAEYETEEIAQYAVRLFSGLVRLHNRTLKFAVRFLFLPGYLICCSIDCSVLFLWYSELYYL
uniref:RRM domain-containing protein n=1 Tax=Triticum urartu TaxID=4572 RepID=A0A8R7K139_TRIUA